MKGTVIALASLIIISGCGGGGGSQPPPTQQSNQQTSQSENRPPTAFAGSDVVANSGTQVALRGSGSDPDGGTLSYDWTQIGGGPRVALTADAATATFTAPRVTTDAVLTFQLTVTDAGGRAATDEILITVNAPPAAVADNQSVDSGANVVLDGSGSSDPGGGTLSYSWRQIPGGPRVVLSQADTATPTFLAPTVTEDTAVTFQLTVTDSHGLAATNEVTVVVTNAAPTVAIGYIGEVGAGDLVILDGSGSGDPGDGTLTYAWRQLSGEPRIVLLGGDTTTPSFIAPTVTEYVTLTFQLTVTDSGGLAAVDEVSVTVANAAPTAVVTGSGQNPRSGETVTLDGSRSGAANSGISYNWVQTGGPLVALSNTGTATPTFTAPDTTTNTALTFQLTVMDEAGLPAARSVSVIVTDDTAEAPPNNPPVASARLGGILRPGERIMLLGSDSFDPEGGVLDHRWERASGPEVRLENADTADASFIVPALANDATLTFRLTVEDEGEMAVSIWLSILVNAPPIAEAGNDQSVSLGSNVPVTLDGSDSFDPGGGELLYSWLQEPGGPSPHFSRRRK